MLRRLAILVALALAGLLAFAPPAKAEPSRIVAVGDLHGDWEAWQAIARGAGLVDPRGRWRGGRTVLVQLGDIVDRGPDSLRIIDHLQRLQRQAPRSGGRVIVLVGNHEAMMMTGDLRYVHPGEYAAFVTRSSERLRSEVFSRNRPAIEAEYRRDRPTMPPEAIRQAWLRATPLGLVEHQAAWSPQGHLGRWTLTNSAIVKLDDTLFVHGGLSAELAPLGIEEINRRVQLALRAQDQAPTSIIGDPLGPLWYRGHVLREPGSDEAPSTAAGQAAQAQRPSIPDELDLVLRSTGARRVVIGHTPSRQGIIVEHGGKLVRADSAISRAYGGSLSWVEIVGDRVTPRSVARPGSAAGGR